MGRGPWGWYSTNVYMGSLRSYWLGPTITLLYTIFQEKGTVYVFRISSIDKWYPVIHTLFRTLHPFQLL